MSIFNNPDFLTIKSLDFESKLHLPTTQLIEQTVWKLNSLYQEIKAVLTQFHGSIALEAKRFYDHPIDTATVWYEQALGYGNQTYARVSGEILPKVDATYEQAILDVSEFGRQTGEFWQAFYNNPEMVVVSLMEPVSAQFRALIDTSEAVFNTSLEATETYWIGLYSAMIDLLNLLLEQPGLTLTALYQNMLSTLLDTYFEIVTALLGML